jgi:predicted GIY-YIG superfamily endonuclease
MLINGYYIGEEAQKELLKKGVYCYILKMRNGKYYTGITAHLIKRLTQHNQGNCFTTRLHRPITLLYIAKFSNYKDARWLEKKIKHRGARNYLCHSYAKK